MLEEKREKHHVDIETMGSSLEDVAARLRKTALEKATHFVLIFCPNQDWRTFVPSVRSCEREQGQRERERERRTLLVNSLIPCFDSQLMLIRWSFANKFGLIFSFAII
jgi:hypothetical protein